MIFGMCNVSVSNSSAVLRNSQEAIRCASIGQVGIQRKLGELGDRVLHDGSGCKA